MDFFRLRYLLRPVVAGQPARPGMQWRQSCDSELPIQCIALRKPARCHPHIGSQKAASVSPPFQAQCNQDHDHCHGEGLDLAPPSRDHGAASDELPLCCLFIFRQPIKLRREPHHLLTDRLILDRS